MAERVAYLTDLEGMWDRLVRYADGNRDVWLDDRAGLTLADGVTFVYGGDTIDRGPAGRRILATLLEARRRYGERVVLLAGNRDINKIRLRRELAGHPPRRAPEGLPRAELLRWIFDHTMGARDAFEHRRRELGPSDDEAVTESFLDDLAPDGLLHAYLAAARIAYRRGRTLFVHGGVTRENLGLVPEREGRVPLAEWPEALNDFYVRYVDAFRAGEAAHSLVLYQAPAPGQRTNPASVVYGRSTDEHNNLVLPGGRAVDELREAGIHRIVVGHTPTGDTPAIARRDGFELICADNSYARVPDGARVVVTDDCLAVDAPCLLDDGRRARVDFTLAADDDRSPIGRRTRESGHLVKGRLASGEWLLFRSYQGFRTEQLAVTTLPALESP
jgi:hypothetical protein